MCNLPAALLFFRAPERNLLSVLPSFLSASWCQMEDVRLRGSTQLQLVEPTQQKSVLSLALVKHQELMGRELNMNKTQAEIEKIFGREAGLPKHHFLNRGGDQVWVGKGAVRKESKSRWRPPQKINPMVEESIFCTGKAACHHQR